MIDAVRCALSLGDYNSAESYLKSAVKDSKDEKIIAYVKLYTEWAKLCRAENEKELRPVVETLKSFVGSDKMKSVEPSVLLTLYHLTGENSYSRSLKNKYPSSMEYAVVSGSVQQLPLPFWYFVPRSTDNFFDSLPENQDSKTVKTANESKNDKNQNSDTRKVLRQQLGLFKVEKNAKKLEEKLKSCGFNARIITDTRADKLSYYSVVVDEDKNGTMGKKLNDAGFACSPVME
ncbi:SPOR domain-containing protein [Treponema zioleckii]|uniref:SPOR domain-containing protein n=1 Tax=Treponema zioleckii TaxID=331680 RepID=UPI00168B9785|nr:SPOR domain-containing protein [Treponema zioleckii]